MLSQKNFSAEVWDALQLNKPVLALESTLISHGLPYPHNVAIAKDAEQIAREYQVTPATIAIIQGQIKIGLTAEDLEILISDQQAVKANRSDIPIMLSQKCNAGTTVAATLFLAQMAGIKVFATGGIGGVHRGEAQDVSADLVELSKTPMAVICSGPKAILDLPKTLEYLETFSVPVIGYQTHYLPAFYSISSPYKLSHCAHDLSELTMMILSHWQCALPSSMLIVNPIPLADEIPNEFMESAIFEALQKAEQQHIYGKALTPFLLNEIKVLTQGKSLKANISLIKHNVKLGSQLVFSLHNSNKSLSSCF